jgi:hypothetical protein
MNERNHSNEIFVNKYHKNSDSHTYTINLGAVDVLERYAVKTMIAIGSTSCYIPNRIGTLCYS